MMKLSHIAATLMMIFCMGFSYAEDNVFIKGQIQNAEGKTIYLDYFENGVLVTIDSCNIIKKGKFEISIELKEPDFYRLRFVKNDFILLVLAKNEKIEITADANELNQSYSITGSPASSEIQEFLGIFNQYNNEVLAIREKQNDPKVPMEEKKELFKQEQIANNEYISSRNKFIQENCTSLSVLATLSQLDDNKDLALIKQITEGIGKTHPTSKYYTELVKKVKQIELQQKATAERAEQVEPVPIGSVAPELNFPDPLGRVITLESLRGKYVLLDFWASWCGPCRRENPNVVRAYNKYKDAGFTVFSVSLDKDKNRWLQAIKGDGLVWPNHVSDLKQWRSEAVRLYGFRGIPHTILLDKEGKVIQKNLRGAALEVKLEELLGF